MEIVRIDINKDFLQTLVDSDVIKTSDFEVIKVSVNDFPYDKYPEWIEQKKISNSEYQKLKELEFKLRHQKK